MKRILVVDDSMFMRQVLAGILAKTSGASGDDYYEILEAETGSEALRVIEEEEIDLVLLDIVMPGGPEEGIRVLEAIASGHPDIPVIMLTAVGQETVVARCRELGASDYIAKPFEEPRVLEAVREQLAGKVASRE